MSPADRGFTMTERQAARTTQMGSRIDAAHTESKREEGHEYACQIHIRHPAHAPVVDDRNDRGALFAGPGRFRASGRHGGEPARKIPKSHAATRAEPVSAPAVPRIAGI